MKKLLALVMVLPLAVMSLALNFGDPSPDAGEADGGMHQGLFKTAAGSFADTRSSNDIYFGVERAKHNLSAANQTLSFNVSTITSNLSRIITAINWSIMYCHAEKVTNSCGEDDEDADGTALSLGIFIQNASKGNYVKYGALAPTAHNIKNTSRGGVSSQNFTQFVNSTGQVNLRFEFLWNGSGRSAFLNDYTHLTLSYDAQPVVTPSSPSTGSTFPGITSVTLECNASDQTGLVNLTLYHNLSGIFTANQTNSVSGRSNSSQFFLSSVPLGHYGWNCLAEDGVTEGILAAHHFTFSVLDNLPPQVTFTAPTATDLTNLSSAVVFINVSVADADSPIGSCLLEVGGSNFTMSKIDGGGNVSCYREHSFQEGTQLYRVYANDTVGNLAVSATRTIVVDSSGPSVAFVAPTDPDHIIVGRNNTFVNVTITDLSSIGSCLLEINATNTSMARGGTEMNISCQLNWTGMVDGSYAYRVHANDTLGNKGASSWRTINISASAPTVTFVFPTEPEGAVLRRNDLLVNISAASSGFANIDSCTLFFGSAGSMLKVVEGTNAVCSLNKTALGEGAYNYSVTANDTVGSLGSSGNRSVVIDVTAPLLAFVNPTPTNTSNLSVVFLTVNITVVDSLTLVDRCWMEWNGTNDSLGKSSSGASGSVSCSVLQSDLVDGRYDYLVYANDSGNNVAVKTRTLTIDTKAPALAFGSSNAADGLNSSTNTVTLVVDVTDQTTTINSCILEWNGTNESMSKAVPGAVTTCSATKASLADGSYAYRTYATDSAGNMNISSQRAITIDTMEVNFWSLATTPSTVDDLDPGVLITVQANITDHTTGIRTAKLQYTLNSSESYTNVTLNYVAALSLWNASFNASTAGGYNVRLWAEDFAGNANFSTMVNLSVQTDRTWMQSPAALGTVSAGAGAEANLGILVLNNTGDVELTFGLQADYANTTLNETFPLVIAAGTVRRINITAIAPSSNGVTVIMLTANASPKAEPTEMASTVNLVVSEDAFLAAALTSFPENIVQGAMAVTFSARVKNVGQKNATSVSFWYTLPEGWIVTAGSGNVSIGDLAVAESATNTIEVNVPAGAMSGAQTILVNATGYNETGSLLRVLGQAVSVVIQTPAASLGSDSGGSRVDSSSAEAGSTAGGVESSNPAAEVEVQKLLELEPIYTSETVEITAGESQIIPVRVTNTYENAVWKNVKLDVEGFMKKYVVVSPPLIDLIRSLDSKEFLLQLSVPEYFTKAEYTLTARITATLVPQNPELVGYTEKKISEIRTFTLKTSRGEHEQIQGELSEAQELVAKLQMEGYTTAKGELLLKKIEAAVDNKDYDTATLLLGQLEELLTEAQETKVLLTQLQGKIRAADRRWLPVSQTQELTGLALLALERGDFSLALVRAEEAQRQFLLSTYGRINILWVIHNYWWIIILVFIMLLLGWSILWPRVLRKGEQQNWGFLGGKENHGRKKYKRGVPDHWVQLELPEWKKLELHEEKTGIQLPHKKG